MSKAKNTLSEYVILNAYPLQQWFHESASCYVTHTLPLLFIFCQSALLTAVFIYCTAAIHENCVVNGVYGHERQFEKCIAPNSGFLEQKTVYRRPLCRILPSSNLCAILQSTILSPALGPYFCISTFIPYTLHVIYIHSLMQLRCYANVTPCLPERMVVQPKSSLRFKCF